MILVDTGPLVALFDPRDRDHEGCTRTLSSIREPVCTTVPVLTEAFHLLHPDSPGSDRLRDFVSGSGLSLWFLNDAALTRAFELMEQYSDHPMDLADASIVAAAEALSTLRVFTLDRNDFATYRVRRGHRRYPFEVLG
jgi:hypothetical protein